MESAWEQHVPVSMTRNTSPWLGGTSERHMFPFSAASHATSLGLICLPGWSWFLIFQAETRPHRPALGHAGSSEPHLRLATPSQAKLPPWSWYPRRESSRGTGARIVLAWPWGTTYGDPILGWMNIHLPPIFDAHQGFPGL